MSSPKALTSTAPATDTIDDRWRDVGRALRRLAPKTFNAALFAHEVAVVAFQDGPVHKRAGWYELLVGKAGAPAARARVERAERRAAAHPRRRSATLGRRAAPSARRGAR